MSRPRTFAVKSYGCQMNVYDSERIGELLGAQGMQPAGEGEAADLVVLNTCHIREKAAEKVYSEIGRVSAAARKAGRTKPMIAVAGCVAQAEGGEIATRAPAVDIVVGPQAYHRLPELIEQGRHERVVDVDLAALEKFGRLPARARRVPASSFLTVQEGCDKFCTYCVVPYTRGSEVSRGADVILAEAEALVAGGAREIVLLGQNVNAWEADGLTLAGLIHRLAAIPQLARIRYTTSHPNDMREDLIAAHAEVPQLMPYLHLPVQSGSDRVLRAMNRSHTVESYLRVIERLRSVRPDMAISGDFIVGFPGETEAEFEATLAIVEAVNYAAAYTFKYSIRPGTPAAEMDGQLSEQVKDERLQRLQALVSEKSLAFNRSKVGHVMDVLLERAGRRPGQLVGKSPWLQSVHVEGDQAIGDIVAVEIVDAGPNSLKGVPMTRKAAA